jgi:hypothetical protein
MRKHQGRVVMDWSRDIGHCSKKGEARKETGCVLMMRQGEGMAKQRDKT